MRPENAFVTDAAATARRARDAADQTVRFRAWVRSECGLSDADLDDLVRRTADEVWAHVDCRACGRCCHAKSVAVDRDDIARLGQHLGTGARAFERRYVRVTDGGPGIVAGPCPFLADTVCTVYEARPTACRDFPFLHSPGFRSRMLLLIELSFTCPIVLHTLELLNRRLEWRGRRGQRRRVRRNGAPGAQGPY